MHNWSVDTKELKKDKRKFAIWRLEQLINFGADGEKISGEELRSCWNELVVDDDKRRFLGFLLWGKKFLTKNK